MPDISRRSFLKVIGIGSASIATGIGLFSKKGKALPLSKGVQDIEIEYSLVKFLPKQHYYEPNDIILSVNGKSLVIQRDIPVVVPNIYLEVADHAVMGEYNKKRKQYATRVICPYIKIRSATYKEFINQKGL